MDKPRLLHPGLRLLIYVVILFAVTEVESFGTGDSYWTSFRGAGTGCVPIVIFGVVAGWWRRSQQGSVVWLYVAVALAFGASMIVYWHFPGVM
jgi:hypothetical protein